VFATSGAGKSYAVKLEILRLLMVGVSVIVIDPEFEYKQLSDAVGGTFINISLASEAKVNPFDLPRPVGEQVSTEDIIRSAVITLKGLFRVMFGAITNEEDSILDRALLETFAKKDITPDSDLATVEAPVMADFESVLEGLTGAENMLIKVKKYTQGTFAGLLNRPTNVDMSNQLVVYCVRDLEDELRPTAIYTIVNYIWNEVRSKRKKRALMIDEAWWLMQHEDSARFIFALVKRARKYFLGVTTITQDVNDFLGSQYGQAIVTNSSMQLLLKQSPASVDNLVKVFMLTEGEKFLLLESAVGEGIFFAGQKHAAIKIVASYNEDQIVTTNPQQLLKMEEERRRLREEQEAEDRERGNDAGAQAALDSVVPLEFNPTTDEAAIPATPPSPVTP
jgi:type IV secretory pathway VirB4 component